MAKEKTTKQKDSKKTIIHLLGFIGEKMFKDFTMSVNELTAADRKNIEIYLNSSGGETIWIQAFTQIIEQYQMKVIAFGEISSSALLLFLNVNTPRTILENTFGVMHYPYLLTSVSVKTKTFIEPVPFQEPLKQERKYFEKIMEITDITEKEKKKLQKGKDVCLNEQRLRNSLKNSENRNTKEKL